MKIILISLLISIQCFADPSFLDKNQPAPYAGILFTTQDAQDLRKQLIDLDTTKMINTSLTKSIDLYKSNEDLYQKEKQILLDRNDNLAKTLYSQQHLNDLEKVGIFVLGIAATGLAIWGVGQLRP